MDIRHGYGTFVKEQGEANDPQLLLFARHLNNATPQNLETRQIFERNCVELTASPRGAGDLRKVEDQIDAMRVIVENGDDDVEGALNADPGFHKAIYAAAENELIETLANLVLHQVAPWTRKSVEVSMPSRAVLEEPEFPDRFRAGDSGDALNAGFDLIGLENRCPVITHQRQPVKFSHLVASVGDAFQKPTMNM